MNQQTNQTLSPLVIPLLSAQEDKSVFDEVGTHPVSLRRKAQFFLDQKLYGRARQMIQLLEDLGERDSPLQLTLASLMILEGHFDAARRMMAQIQERERYATEIALCHSEIERYQQGPQRALAYLLSHQSPDSDALLKRIEELQGIDITEL